jgi:hypothetical protein
VTEDAKPQRLSRLRAWWRKNHPPLDFEARCYGLVDARYWTISCPCGADVPDECLHEAHANAEQVQAPDAYCVTTPDGDCISNDPRCMHGVV